MSQLKKRLLKVIYSVIFNLGVVSRSIFSLHSSGIFIVNANFHKPFTTNLLSSAHFQSLSLTAEKKLQEWERDAAKINKSCHDQHIGFPLTASSFNPQLFKMTVYYVFVCE